MVYVYMDILCASQKSAISLDNGAVKIIFVGSF